MLKRVAILFAVVLSLSACSDRSSHGAPPPEIAGLLTIDNNEFEDVDIFLDDEYVGTVAGGSTSTFAVFPGDYLLTVDFVGDNAGPLDYTTVRLRTDVEVIVDVEVSLVGALIDIIFD